MQMSYKDIFERAKSKGYLLAKWRKTDVVEEDYYKWCEKENIPLIKAFAGNKYAQVSINMDTTSYVLNEEGQDKIAALYRKYTRKPSSVAKGHIYCSVDDVSNDSVDILVKEIIQICEACKVPRTSSINEETY